MCENLEIKEKLILKKLARGRRKVDILKGSQSKVLKSCFPAELILLVFSCVLNPLWSLDSPVHGKRGKKGQAEVSWTENHPSFPATLSGLHIKEDYLLGMSKHPWLLMTCTKHSRVHTGLIKSRLLFRSSKMLSFPRTIMSMLGTQSPFVFIYQTNI